MLIPSISLRRKPGQYSYSEEVPALTRALFAKFWIFLGMVALNSRV